jgi:hypothetical protein
MLVSETPNLDEFWFHYSGHGSQIQDQNSEMKDIIIPSDYLVGGVIKDIELFNMIREIKCRCIMVFDCCHSGSICDMPWTFEYTPPHKYKKTQTNTVTIENPNIFVFSGCRDNESSADSLNTLDQSMGAFTNAFVESLRANHHKIGVMNVYKNTCDYLIKNGYSQHPLLSSSRIDSIQNRISKL